MKMTEELTALLAQWNAAKEVEAKAYTALEAAVVASCGYKVGDKVKYWRYGQEGVGRVTKIKMLHSFFAGEFTFQLSIYPINKNGETAKIGKYIYLPYSSDPAPVVKREN